MLNKHNLQIFLLTFLLSEFSQKESYSHNPYSENTLHKYGHFYQLPSKDIIGTSSQNRLTFKYNSSNYIYTQDNTINFLNFTSSIFSKSELQIKNNTQVLIPCVKIEDKYYEILKIDLQSNSYQLIKDTNYDIEGNQNQQCGISTMDTEDYYLTSTIMRSGRLSGINKCYGSFYYLETGNYHLIFRYDTCVSYTKGQHNCLYIKKHSFFTCMMMDANTNTKKIDYGPVDRNGHAYISTVVFEHGLDFSDILDVDEYLANFINKEISNSSCILVITTSKSNFVVYFIDYFGWQSSQKEIYSDYIKREGNYDALNYLRLSEDYFIIYGNNNNQKFVIYLYEISSRKLINMAKSENLRCSYCNIIFNYNKTELILINQNQGESIDIFEFSILKCRENFTIPIENGIKEIDIYNLLSPEFTNEDRNEQSISISFVEISSETDLNHLIILGILESETTLNEINIGQDYFYKSIYVKYNSDEEITIPFSFILRRNFHNLTIPSYVGNSSFTLKCISNCKKCTKKGNENNHYCTKCNNNYYPMKDDYEKTISNLTGQGFNCYSKINSYFIKYNNYFEKCYDSCFQCSEQGNETDNKCDKCNEGFSQLSEFTGNSSDQNCIEFCSTKTNTWFFNTEITTDNKGFVCNYDDKCPNYMGFLSNSTRLCVYKDESMHKKYKNNATIFEMTQYDIKKLCDLLFENATLFFSPLQNEIIGNNFTLGFYDVSDDNQSNVEVSDECIGKIRNKYDIHEDESIYLSVLNLTTRYYLTNQIEINLFSGNGTYINISKECPGESTYINYSITKPDKVEYNELYEFSEKYNVNVFEAEDKFFNDYCSAFKYNNKDVPVSLRRELFFQNYSLCDENCSLVEIYENEVKCQCDNSKYHKLNYEFTYRNNSKNNYNKEISEYNSKYLNCYKGIFKNLFKNSGFLVTGTMNCLCIITYIYIIKDTLANGIQIASVANPIKIKKKVGKKHIITVDNSNNIINNINSSNINSINNNNTNNKNNRNNRNNRNNNDNNLSRFNSLNRNSPMKSMKNEDPLQKSNINYSKSIINNNNKKEISFNPINPNQIIINDNLEKKNENKESNNNNQVDLDISSKRNNELSFKFNGVNSNILFIKEYQKLNLKQLIMSKNLVLSLLDKDKLKLKDKAYNIITLLSDYIFTFCIHCSLFDDNFLHKIYKIEEKFSFVNSIPKVLIVLLLMQLFSIGVNLYIAISKKFKKIIHLLLINLLLIINFFMCYYVSSFCYVNELTTINMFVSGLLTIIFDFFLSFGLSLVIYGVRNIGYKTNNDYIIFISELLYIL